MEQSKLGKKSAKCKMADCLKAIAKMRSVNVISSQKRVVAKTSRKKSNELSDIISEEKEYQKKLQWLKDHGDMTGDEGKKLRSRLF